MSITITVAESVPDDAFERIVKLSRSLQKTDLNFRDVPLAGRRGPLTAVSVEVNDTDDEMRERLLLLLVADVLKTEPESQMGGLY